MKTQKDIQKLMADIEELEKEKEATNENFKKAEITNMIQTKKTAIINIVKEYIKYYN